MLNKCREFNKYIFIPFSLAWLKHLSLIYTTQHFLDVYFHVFWSSLGLGLFSSYGARGLLSSCSTLASHCGGVSCLWVHGLQQALKQKAQ